MLELFNSYRVELQHIASVVLALAIWRWGAGPERWLIGVFLATMIVPVYIFMELNVVAATGGPYAWLYLLIDLVALVGFGLIAINANRNYPLWIAGFQLVAIGAHASKELVDGISPLAIAILVIGPSYAQLLLIFGGFVRHVQRERRFGPYREWRSTRRRLAPLQF